MPFVRANKRVEPKWKTVERVVALLERSITLDARVEHNVQLPVLASPSLTRQCDVVVRTGAKHRETLTIVEVQRRWKKVDVNTFGGWLHKMRAVGAQHLICVSTAGFPQSVIREAQLIGPTVRLLTLDEVAAGHWLLGAIGSVEVIKKTVSPSETVTVDDLDGSKPLVPHSVKHDFHERCLETPVGQRFSLQEVAQLATDQLSWEGRPVGTYKYPLSAEPFLWHYGGAKPAKVRLRFEITIVLERTLMPVSVSEYRQVGEGSVAWVATFSEENGRKHHLTFVPDKSGRLNPAGYEVADLSKGSTVTVSVNGIDFTAAGEPYDDPKAQPLKR